MGDFINWLLGLFGAAPEPEPDPSDPCNAPTCVNAKNKVATARGKFNRICTGLKSLKVVADALATVVKSPIWVLVAVLVVVALIGALIGATIAGVAGLLVVVVLAVWAISWFLLLVIGKMTEALVPELLKQQKAVTDGVNDVIANCPQNCRGDVSTPQCDLG